MQNKIELKPNLSIVFIGDSITDAGRLDAAVLFDEYQLTYKRLLSLVKEKYNCRLIPMTWFILTCGRTHGSRSNGSK